MNPERVSTDPELPQEVEIPSMRGVGTPRQGARGGEGIYRPVGGVRRSPEGGARGAR